MRTTLALTLAAALAAPTVKAQQTAPPGVEDWRMPFRSPQANLVPPADMWTHLRPMYEIARQVAPELKRFENGVEIVDDPTWIEHHDKLMGIRLDGGYLSTVLRESQHIADRAIGFYGAFQMPDPGLVFQLIEHIPGEPVRGLREDAYQRAVEFVRVHLPSKVPGDLDAWEKSPRGPDGQPVPRPGDWAYGFDPAPFVALLSVADWRDREQALWFLARCGEARPDFGRYALEIARPRLAELLRSGPTQVRVALRDLVAAVDPTEDREQPADDAGETAWVDWFEAAMDAVFPPIRRLSDGLFELHPHRDRDHLVAVATEGLGAGTLGTGNVNGTTAAGAPYRGFRIEKLPEPLDRLGLAVGDVLTAVDGIPVPTADRLFRTLDKALPQRREFVLEFVDRRGQQRAIRYRVR
jgi:hypothetical protein